MSNRLQRLQTSIRDRKLDALFVSHPLNVRYLSGFHCPLWNLAQPFVDPEGFVLVRPDEAILLHDARYTELPDLPAGMTARRIPQPGYAVGIEAALRDWLGQSKQTCGMEDRSTLCSDCAVLESIENVTWERVGGLVDELRHCKDADELDLLRKAEQITSDAYQHICGNIVAGDTEKSVALKLDDYLRSHSEGIAFETIVGFGRTGSSPHYAPSPDRVISDGGPLLMDFGAVHAGYHGDLTRVVSIGPPTGRFHEVYDLVLQAQHRVLENTRPGMTGHQLDALARDFFKERNLGDHFRHGTGHGVGLAIHEPPRLREGFDDPIEPGMVITIEPGLYFDDWGGVRIEDMVIVTDDGIENITPATKEIRTINL